jgi:phosphoribosylamine--glycine ligase
LVSGVTADRIERVNGVFRVHAAGKIHTAGRVVLAAGGYPGRYEHGHRIHGLDSGFPDHVKVFHAGTRLDDHAVVTAGGRVLCVCALGRDVTGAQREAYAACDRIGWHGAFRRNDIGFRAVRRERST